ncbi:hypothetical protein P691DRAFT_827658 [Macrolepiota fuliginosa MF-IS2]|uniref:ATP-grasp domain-containing protein n=1 Tax=Macrolepiota fuliginosa MF-IS2 TaxID=1400762 RepID=A0A9P5XBN5_9AGAR|nr:hypothetical protein P691DRAFT_827658 [Macrolepiota fuliginosa MF-IS2]
MPKSKNYQKALIPLNVLLTNGRFPVTIDLARQLKKAGHTVYVVDPMHYHVCKFSRDVKKSYKVPAPHYDPSGYIQGLKHAIKEATIDLIIPMHEEILFCADAARTDVEIFNRLLAPPFETLVRLHSKWEFSKFLVTHGLDCPQSVLCRNYEDVERLNRNREWALKPVFGRASLNVFHLKPSEPLPHVGINGVEVNDDNNYVAQEWLKGERYCSYSVLQDGEIVAHSVYPVEDTIDGSSCVYFESIEHPGIFDYVQQIANVLPGVSGQVAFDFVETTPTDNAPRRLVPFECNPRSTAGIHLWSGTTDLALALTCRTSMYAPHWNLANDHTFPRPGAKRQVAPGMLMWKRTKGVSHKMAIKEYFSHMKKLVFIRDVVCSMRDLMPTLMEPFLLTSYYEICREQGLKLATMFQNDLTWEPAGAYLCEVRELIKQVDRNIVEPSQQPKFFDKRSF